MYPFTSERRSGGGSASPLETGGHPRDVSTHAYRRPPWDPPAGLRAAGNRQDASFIKGDMVIEAIGQAMDISYITQDLADHLEYEGRRIKVNDRFQSSIHWLFVGGDMVQGPDVVTAVYNGHQAAEGIDAFLKGEQS